MFSNVRSFAAGSRLTLSFGGQSKDGIRGSTDITQVHDDPGVWDDYSFSVTVNPAEWTTAPSTGDAVVISAVTYQVLVHKDDQFSALRRLDLGEQYAAG